MGKLKHVLLQKVKQYLLRDGVKDSPWFYFIVSAIVSGAMWIVVTLIRFL